MNHSVPLLAALLLVPTAHAQGPIPFELGDPGEASQIVEMFLAIHDVHEPYDGVTSIASDDELWLVVNRNDGDADAGSLLVCPAGSCTPLPFGGFYVPAGESEGSYWVIGDGTPYTTGLYYADNSGAGTPLTYVKGEADSSYDLSAGTMDVDAEVVTPDYGEYRESVGEHGVESMANVRIHDWVYVDGPGSTATVSVSATIDPYVESPVQGTSEEFWTTEAYGDVRTVDPDSPSGLDPDLLEPTMTQSARLEVRLDIDEWFFEEFCEGEGEDVFCFEEWVSQSAATASALRENYLYLDWVYPPSEAPVPELVPDDTDTLTGTLATQATIETGQWVEVSAQVIATVDCEGAFACDLDASTGDPVQVSITSPDGTLVAWHGIAGLTRVPEPESGAAVAVAVIAALHGFGRRLRRSRRLAESSEQEESGMNRDVAPSDRASLLGAFPRWAADGLLLLLLAFAWTIAALDGADAGHDIAVGPGELLAFYSMIRLFPCCTDSFYPGPVAGLEAQIQIAPEAASGSSALTALLVFARARRRRISRGETR